MSDEDRLKQAAAASRAASDPLQQAGTHPLGTAAGAVGGAVAGAVAGIAAGPVGSLAGAVGGAIAGGVLGSGATGSEALEGPVVESGAPSVDVDTRRAGDATEAEVSPARPGPR
jgi:phage tail tape-measure protein